jgi:hypothetical protein
VNNFRKLTIPTKKNFFLDIKAWDCYGKKIVYTHNYKIEELRATEKMNPSQKKRIYMETERHMHYVFH